MSRGIVRRKRGEKDRGRGKDWGRADERRRGRGYRPRCFSVSGGSTSHCLPERQKGERAGNQRSKVKKQETLFPLPGAGASQ